MPWITVDGDPAYVVGREPVDEQAIASIVRLMRKNIRESFEPSKGYEEVRYGHAEVVLDDE